MPFRTLQRIWVATWEGKINQILCSDWLPERPRWRYLTRLGDKSEHLERNVYLLHRPSNLSQSPICGTVPQPVNHSISRSVSYYQLPGQSFTRPVILSVTQSAVQSVNVSRPVKLFTRPVILSVTQSVVQSVSVSRPVKLFTRPVMQSVTQSAAQSVNVSKPVQLFTLPVSQSVTQSAVQSVSVSQPVQLFTPPVIQSVTKWAVQSVSQSVSQSISFSQPVQ